VKQVGFKAGESCMYVVFNDTHIIQHRMLITNAELQMAKWLKTVYPPIC